MREEVGPRAGGRLAAGLALGMLALGLALGAGHAIGGYGVESDFYGFYGPGARQLLAGEAYTHTRSGPGYSALLAAGGALGLDLFTTAKLAAAVATAALGWLAFVVVRALAGTGPALLTQGLLYASLVDKSFTAGNDVVAAALVAAALALALRGDRPSPGALAVAGVATGLATATRFTGVVVLPVLLAWILLLPGDAASAGLRARRAAALVLGFAAACAPMWIAYAVWHGDPLYNRTHALIALDAFGPPGQKTSMTQVVAMEDRFPSLGAVLAHDPARLVAHYALDVYRDLGQMLIDLVALPALVFVGPGVWWLAVEPSPARHRRGVWLVVGALSFAAAALVPYQARYHVPHLAVALGGAALGMTRLLPSRAPRLARALVVAALAVPAAMSGLKAARELAHEPRDVLPAAAELARHVRPGDAVVVRKPHLAFLAGARAEYPRRFAEQAAFMTWLQDSGARFLLVGPQEVGENRHLAPLTDGSGTPQGLRLLYAGRDPACALYELVAEPAGGTERPR